NNIALIDKVRLIRCGNPVPDLPPIKNNKKLKIIAASRFVKEIGLDIFIYAVGMLDDKLKQKAEFYIAGEGELENELKQLNKNFDAGIIFLGSLRNIYKTLSETDVLIFPSRSANEGFPA